MLNNQGSDARGRRQRRRLRGIFAGKRGKQIGLLSFVTPLAGYVIQDLRKPDSVIKSIAQRAYLYLAERKTVRRQRIDPAGRVEVLQTNSNEHVPQASQLRKEQ